MNELALFAGAGGGILGGHLLGWRTVCAVEYDTYAASVLIARQNDGCLEAFPVWDDVRTFDGKPWCGIVDVISGGFPCQDISVAGKGAGITGERSGLWGEMRRIISEVRPRYVFVENSPALTFRGLGTVLGDLAALGYDARWGVLGAIDAGAPHKRERIWIRAFVPDANESNRSAEPRQQLQRSAQFSRCRKNNMASGANVANAAKELQHGSGNAWNRRDEYTDGCTEISDANQTRRENKLFWIGSESAYSWPRICSAWWNADPADAEDAIKSGMGRLAYGVASRVDRLACLGNGQVPAVAALAWEILSRSHE